MGWPRSGFFIAVASVLAGQAPTAPTFHATTKLVQVSVVAHDRKGAPVADLRREEFQILDNGAPQEIRVFAAETEKSSPTPSQNLAPNTDADARKALLGVTTLAVNGKDHPIAAKDVVYVGEGMIEARFLFPRDFVLTADDKEVEFATLFGKAAVKAKFNLKNMAINGKLGL
jgi:VWFA-related protein